MALTRTDPFEGVVEAYVHNLVVGTRLAERRKRMHDLDDSELLVAFVEPGTTRHELPSREEVRRALRRYIRAHGRKLRTPPPPQQPVTANLVALGELCNLGEGDLRTLEFILAVHMREDLDCLCRIFEEQTLSGAATIIAAATAQDHRAVVKALGRGAPLARCGLLQISEDREHLSSKLTPRRGLHDLVTTRRLGRKQLLDRFLPAAPAPRFEPTDFAELASELEAATAILRGALSERQPGVNILLYGPTGTGKTELARVLARRAGGQLYAAGRGDDEGGSPTAEERIASLALGHRMLAQAKAILLLDELEDLFHWEWSFFGRTASARTSKEWLNDLLETNPVPTIWITNQVQGIDPAYLRRFGYVIEVSTASVQARVRVLARHLGPGSPLPAEDLAQIAARFPEASHAQLATAVKLARLLDPDRRPGRAGIETVLAPTARLLTGTDPMSRPVFDASSYHLDALNPSEDLVALAEQLSAWRPGPVPGLSLCLYGPPGTGKSEFIKYLAQRMRRRVEVRRASDLLSMWLGQTEQAIADAFRAAERDGALLLFDEVDSFLQDRRSAHRSWEVTQVNEFLQQLECFRGVVACTTNLWRGLDEASLRRFVFKVEFRYIEPRQALPLWRQLLGAAASAENDGLFLETFGHARNLAPGDFAAVTRRFRTCGMCDARSALEALKGELAVKRGPATAIGF